MKTSATETERIDRYLNKHLQPDEHLLFEAQLLLDADLHDKTYWQQKTLELVNFRGRHQLRAEIMSAESTWFSQPEHHGLRLMIFKMFGL